MESLTVSNATYKLYFYGNGVGDIVLSLTGDELKNVVNALVGVAKHKPEEAAKEPNAV